MGLGQVIRAMSRNQWSEWSVQASREVWAVDEDGREHIAYTSGGGYGRGEAPEIPAEKDHKPVTAEGAWLVDHSELDPYLVMSEPLVSNDEERHPWKPYEGVLCLSGWGGMISAANAGGLNLSQVPPEEWAMWWYQRGARVGRWVNGAVEWFKPSDMVQSTAR